MQRGSRNIRIKKAPGVPSRYRHIIYTTATSKHHNALKPVVPAPTEEKNFRSHSRARTAANDPFLYTCKCEYSNGVISSLINRVGSQSQRLGKNNLEVGTSWQQRSPSNTVTLCRALFLLQRNRTAHMNMHPTCRWRARAAQQVGSHQPKTIPLFLNMNQNSGLSHRSLYIEWTQLLCRSLHKTYSGRQGLKSVETELTMNLIIRQGFQRLRV